MYKCGKWNHCSGWGVCGHCNVSVQPSGSRVTAASPLRRGIPCKQTLSLVGRGKWAACMAHVRRIHHIKFSSREGPTLFWRINKHPPVGRKGDYLETAKGNMSVSCGLNVFLYDLVAHSKSMYKNVINRFYFWDPLWSHSMNLDRNVCSKCTSCQSDCSSLINA